MQIIRADKAGFCFGVKRAMEIAEQTLRQGKTASWGELIHNRQVVDYLADKGICKVDSFEELEEGCQLVIRSHGVAPAVYKEIEARNIELVDATCPYVQKAQKLAAELSKDHFIVVVGDKNHPEVQGILGWAGSCSLALESVEEARQLPFCASIVVLSQTTQSQAHFGEIARELEKRTDHLIVCNTICSATQARQESAARTAGEVDVMIVAGGKNSSNTRKLGAICSEYVTTYLVETKNELKEIWFQGVEKAGLTAGASTPDWIIEEVYKNMSEIMDKELTVPAEQNAEIGELTSVEDQTAEAGDIAEVDDIAEGEKDQASMMESYAGGLPQLYRGAIVEGTVVKIANDEIFVDIAWKSEGVIPASEFGAGKVSDPGQMVKVGDPLKAMVIRVENEEGYPVLSRRRVKEIEAKETLAKLLESKEEVQAPVIDAVRGGLLVDLGMRGFIPASQVQMGYVEDLSKYVGETLRLRVIEFDEHKKRLVLSQKVILAEEAEVQKEKLMETLQEGDTVKGTIRRLTNFGAFVDIGGIDGLLHVSDMTFSRINHPSEAVKIGDEVLVQVLSIDKGKGRISLGLKQLKQNPWEAVGEKYPVDTVVTGKVVRIAAFGAFVQLEDGIDALIHISQLANYHVEKVDDVVKVGDTVTAKVIECRPEDRRISISVKKMLSKNETEETPDNALGEAEAGAESEAKEE